MRRVVVDSSLAVKWFLPEPGAQEARQLALTWEDVEVWAPDLIWVEAANAARHKVLAGELSADEAGMALGEFLAANLQVLSCRRTGLDTLSVALHTGLIAWDAAYVSAARALGAELWTADREMQSRGRRAYPNIHLLTWPSAHEGEA